MRLRIGDVFGVAPSRPTSSAVSEFDIDHFLPYQLSIAAMRVSQLFERRYAWANHVSVPEWRVITQVGRNEGASMGEVAAKTCLDKVAVSRAAATLVSRGLLRRRSGAGDTRFVHLSLTASGRRVYERIVASAQEVEALLAGMLNASERDLLGRMLSELRRDVESVLEADAARG